MMKNSAVICLAVLLAVVGTAAALKCFECDLSSSPCTTEVTCEDDVDYTTVCHKTGQDTTYMSGTSEFDFGCYMWDNETTYTNECQEIAGQIRCYCNSDLCNAATSYSNPGWTTVTLAVGTFAVLIMMSGV